MAIGSITSIASLPNLLGQRRVGALGAVGRGEALGPIEPVRPVGRDDDPTAFDKAGEAKEPGSQAASTLAPSLDRRSASAIVGRDRVSATDASLAENRLEKESATRTARPNASLDPARPNESQIRDRLNQLQGEKGRIQRGRGDAQAQQSSETTAMIAKLKARDGEVRGHEAAHIAAGGRYVTGGASYSYQKGPDGVQYAIGGEVGIDSSPIPGKPQETIAKMQVVRAAATAPAEPSGADLSVAAAAAQVMASAVASLAEERAQSGAEAAGTSGPAGPEGPAGKGSGTSDTAKGIDADGSISDAAKGDDLARRSSKAAGSISKAAGRDRPAEPGSIIDLAA
ncbi:MAG: putative metalloprotease CJM1_0395 family protein [Spirochaetota bacterium]